MNISLSPACDADLEDLITLRVEAMRDSLERIGRFDPARAGQRLPASFSAEFKRHITASTCAMASRWQALVNGISTMCGLRQLL